MSRRVLPFKRWTCRECGEDPPYAQMRCDRGLCMSCRYRDENPRLLPGDVMQTEAFWRRVWGVG